MLVLNNVKIFLLKLIVIVDFVFVEFLAFKLVRESMANIFCVKVLIVEMSDLFNVFVIVGFVDFIIVVLVFLFKFVLS